MESDNLERGPCDGMGPLERLFHSAAARITDFLVIHKGSDYSEAEIAEMTGLSTKTVTREMPYLVADGIADVKRTVGRSKLYWLHPRSKAAEDLEKFCFDRAALRIEEKEESENVRAVDKQQTRLTV